jgi:hypothetical protein
LISARTKFTSKTSIVLLNSAKLKPKYRKTAREFSIKLFLFLSKDLYATYTDFENASWSWPTNNFKRSKNLKNGYFSLLGPL